MINGDVFVSVRQRVYAFIYYKEYLKNRSGIDIDRNVEDEYLDSAYRFLNSSVDMEFIKFCADKENMTFEKYCENIGIDIN